MCPLVNWLALLITPCVTRFFPIAIAGGNPTLSIRLLFCMSCDDNTCLAFAVTLNKVVERACIAGLQADTAVGSRTAKAAYSPCAVGCNTAIEEH